MSNEELYKQLAEIYPEEELIPFCEKLSRMYNILYMEECDNNRWEPVEYNYDAKWWYDKWTELLNMF